MTACTRIGVMGNALELSKINVDYVERSPSCPGLYIN
jgi:hypothetical protein